MRKKITAAILTCILAITMTACSTQAEENPNISEETEVEQNAGVTETLSGSKNLIVYFSRWGNTDYPNDVDAITSASIVIDNTGTYGTTEFVARLIQEPVGGDLHLIQTEDVYPTDFDELRDLNHEEMAEEYLPPLAESNLDLEQYDTVFIGYPVWATEVPQAVLSFLDAYDLSGKTVIPFCTHDGYGAGNSYETIAQASHAGEILDGLAIEAEDVPNAEDTVAQWLSEIDVQAQVSENTDDEEGQTTIQITIGDTVLDGVIYDTELAKEIQEEMPLTVSMSGFDDGSDSHRESDFGSERFRYIGQQRRHYIFTGRITGGKGNEKMDYTDTYSHHGIRHDSLRQRRAGKYVDRQYSKFGRITGHSGRTRARR